MADRSGSNLLASLQARLGSSIRSRRRQLGITQEELAWRASLHRTYITDVERGARNITLRTVGQIAAALRTPVGELLADAVPASTAITASESTPPLGEILLIEDNYVDMEMAVRALRLSRLRNPVRVMSDGEEALVYLLGRDRRREPGGILPQLVLLDLHLPRISGLEVLVRIRGDRRTARLPVMVLTISDHDRDMQACRELGVEHYIMKPVTAEALGRVIVASQIGWALVPAGAPEPESAVAE